MKDLSVTFLEVNQQKAKGMPMPVNYEIAKVNDGRNDLTIAFEASYCDPYYSNMKAIGASLSAGENPEATITIADKSMRVTISGDVQMVRYAEFPSIADGMK